ncbi:hypothetical protein J6590_023757 [Homalodisca vitripennis]|nr:hypothetical protein J6590_023757 [Homalodisca vitripennis]
MRTLVLVCLLAAAAFADDAISTLTGDSSSVSSAIASGSVSSTSVLGDSLATKAGTVSKVADSQISQDAAIATDANVVLNDDVSSEAVAEAYVAPATKSADAAVSAVSPSSKVSSVDPPIDEESTVTKKLPVVIMAFLVPYPVSRADPSLSAPAFLRSSPYYPQPFYPVASPYIPVAPESDGILVDGRSVAQVPYVRLYDQAPYANPINPYSQGWAINPYSQGANALPYYQRGFLPVSYSSAKGNYVVPQDYPYRITPLAA